MIIHGDALTTLIGMPDNSIDCLITSPPYWGLRDYGHPEQLGLEPDFNNYVRRLADIFDEVMRVLKPAGTCWVNIGDSYMPHNGTRGNKTDPGADSFRKERSTAVAPNRKAVMHVREKSLCQIPARFGIEMTNRGWILRNKIIWHKPNAMPQSVKDRFTVDYEEIFLFTKSGKYYFNQLFDNLATSTLNDERVINKRFVEKRPERGFIGPASKGAGMLKPHEQGRNKRSVWSVATRPYKDAHFATFPTTLVEPMLLAGCPEGGTVLDPFFGSGTVGVVARRLGREYIGIEINADYITLANQRMAQGVLI